MRHYRAWLICPEFQMWIDFYAYDDERMVAADRIAEKFGLDLMGVDEL